jgi:hypothetical protein
MSFSAWKGIDKMFVPFYTGKRSVLETKYRVMNKGVELEVKLLLFLSSTKD